MELENTCNSQISGTHVTIASPCSRDRRRHHSWFRVSVCVAGSTRKCKTHVFCSESGSSFLREIYSAIHDCTDSDAEIENVHASDEERDAFACAGHGSFLS